jgi:hypothetical protein
LLFINVIIFIFIFFPTKRIIATAITLKGKHKWHDIALFVPAVHSSMYYDMTVFIILIYVKMQINLYLYIYTIFKKLTWCRSVAVGGEA